MDIQEKFDRLSNLIEAMEDKGYVGPQLVEAKREYALLEAMLKSIKVLCP